MSLLEAPPIPAEAIFVSVLDDLDGIGEKLDAAMTPADRLETFFSDQARLTPFSTAISFRGTALRYVEVEHRANQLANHLQARGFGRGAVIGLCLERTPELVIAVLAVWKAGAAYLPLDPNYPDAYVDTILRTCRPSVVLCQSLIGRRRRWNSPVIEIDTEATGIGAQPVDAPRGKGDVDDLAQIIFTSGSTGEPKGVMLSHTARHLITWARQAYSRDETARVAATTSICFDPSVLEILLPLSNGGAILLKQNALERFEPDERPTMLTSVPSVLASLLEADAIPASVRVINCGGERLTASLVDRLFRQSAAQRVFNHYGPTEASICVATSVTERHSVQRPSSLRPIPGVSLYVLDEQQQPVEAGCCGELYIAGRTLALGYHDQPALTAERFQPDPWGEDGERMYRTGDIVRASGAGEIEFVGRRDEQVKIRGYRIELGAVEAGLGGLPFVRRAVAAVRPAAAGEASLMTWLETDRDISLADLREHLRPVLPNHMIPTGVTCLARMPLTASGKIDRKALLSLQDGAAPGAPAPDMTPHELAVVSVFQPLLGRGEVRLDDDFFDLGGSSLLALQVTARLETILARPVDPSLIFSHRSARRLGAALGLQAETCSRHVLALQSEGVERALFCLSDLHGLPVSYLALAARLAPDRPVHVLSPGPLTTAMIKRPSMERLTQAYLREMRSAQPAGPYQVAGYSAGAAPALALACALEDEGEDVLLMLIDPVVSRRLPSLRFTANWLFKDVAPLLTGSGLKATARQLQRLRHVWLRAQRIVTTGNLPRGIPAAQRGLARAMLQAEVDWRFTSFNGRALVVQSSKCGPAEAYINYDGLNGLSGLLTGPLVKVELAAGHVEMMREPHVGALAAQLSEQMLDTRTSGARVDVCGVRDAVPVDILADQQDRRTRPIPFLWRLKMADGTKTEVAALQMAAALMVGLSFGFRELVASYWRKASGQADAI